MDQKYELLLLLDALHTKILKNIQRRLVHGISFSEFLVMQELALSPTKSMRRIDLAESIGMSASGVTRLLAPMEKQNIVEKETHARDARVSLIKLTAAGEELFNDALQSVQEISQNIFEPLDDDAIKALSTLIKSIK